MNSRDLTDDEKNSLIEYFESVDRCIRLTFANVPRRQWGTLVPCTQAIMEQLLEANQNLRSQKVPIYVLDRAVQPVSTHFEQLVADGELKKRGQIIVKMGPHFSVLDYKVTRGNKEVILLDAGADLRFISIVESLAEVDFIQKIYVPGTKFGQSILETPIQRDVFTCPFFSLLQAAQLSRIDPYNSLNKKGEAISQGSKLTGLYWDDMPMQVVMYTQCRNDRLNRLAGEKAATGRNMFTMCFRRPGFTSVDLSSEQHTRFREEFIDDIANIKPERNYLIYVEYQRLRDNVIKYYSLDYPLPHLIDIDTLMGVGTSAPKK